MTLTKNYTKLTQKKEKLNNTRRISDEIKIESKKPNEKKNILTICRSKFFIFLST